MAYSVRCVLYIPVDPEKSVHHPSVLKPRELRLIGVDSGGPEGSIIVCCITWPLNRHNTLHSSLSHTEVCQLRVRRGKLR